MVMAHWGAGPQCVWGHRGVLVKAHEGAGPRRVRGHRGVLVMAHGGAGVLRLAADLEHGARRPSRVLRLAAVLSHVARRPRCVLRLAAVLDHGACRPSRVLRLAAALEHGARIQVLPRAPARNAASDTLRCGRPHPTCPPPPDVPTPLSSASSAPVFQDRATRLSAANRVLYAPTVFAASVPGEPRREARAAVLSERHPRAAGRPVLSATFPRCPCHRDARRMSLS